MQRDEPPPTRSECGKHHLFKAFLKRSQGFIRKVTNDWTMQAAGALAYNLMVAAVPIAIAIIAICGLTLGVLAPGTQDRLVDGLARMFPTGNLSREILQVAVAALKRDAGLLVILAILTSVFGGSRLFIAIEGCFAITYRTSARGVIAQNVMALALMLLFVVLTPLMIFASSLPALLLSLAHNAGANSVPLLAWLLHNSFFLGAIGIASSSAIAWLLFEAIFFVVPNQPVSLKHSWPGALISALLLEAFLACFPLYLTHFMSSYIGAAGFAVILLVFFYYFGLILLLGAQFNAYFAQHIQPLPNNLATVLHDASTNRQQSDHSTCAPDSSQTPTRASS
jgi:YihY family inner membrane protein